MFIAKVTWRNSLLKYINYIYSIEGMRGRWAAAAVGASVAKSRAGAKANQQAQAGQAQQQASQQQIEAQQRQIEAMHNKNNNLNPNPNHSKKMSLRSCRNMLISPKRHIIWRGIPETQSRLIIKNVIYKVQKDQPLVFWQQYCDVSKVIEQNNFTKGLDSW